MARDRFASERLPDLPNVGYSTRLEKEISDAVMFFMRDVERRRPLLLEIVIGGRDKWLEKARKVWGLRAILTTEKLDEIFRYFVMQAGPNPAQQLAALAEIDKFEKAKRRA